MYLADLVHPDDKLTGKLHQLYNLRIDKKIELGFRKPFLQLLEAFGNPHLYLPPTIHVAGTNGKGSTIATLRACLEEQGKTVSAFTSPHLYQFNERLYASCTYISNAALEDLIDEALELNAGREVTFFEITTAMAFAWFTRQKTDYCLLEVGMGGRLDCTNVIEKPIATVITNISYDHQEYLGETIAEIAGEKAGIMKPGVPCISSPQLPEAEKALKTAAAEKGVELAFSTPYEGEVNLPGLHQLENAGTALAALNMITKQDTSLRGTKDDEAIQNHKTGQNYKTELPRRTDGSPRHNEEKNCSPLPHHPKETLSTTSAKELLPPHPKETLSTTSAKELLPPHPKEKLSTTSAKELSPPHPKEKLSTTSAKGLLPPRLKEKLSTTSAKGLSPPRPKEKPTRTSPPENALCKIQWPGRLENVAARLGYPEAAIWYDGGCNESAGAALAQQMKEWQAQDHKDLHLIVGMKGDKHADSFLEPLKPCAESLRVVPIPKLSKCLGADEVEGAIPADNIMAALEQLKPLEGKRVLITGSLYLAAQIPARHSGGGRMRA